MLKILKRQKFFTGNDLSLIDIAWFIYTYRLFISGFPFDDKFPLVSQWFQKLYSRKEFFNEVNDPFLFKLIRLYARISNNLSGKSITPVFVLINPKLKTNGDSKDFHKS